MSTPTSDTHIAHRYGSSSLDQKLLNKTELQEELGWVPEPKRPVVCLPAGMSDKLGGKLFEELLPGLLSLPIEILVVGKGSANFGSLFTKLSKEHKHRIAIIQNDEKSMSKMYAAADMALFLANPEGSKELNHCLSYGVVPISLPAGNLEDYDPAQEAGNAFVFTKENPWLCFMSLVRALETYKLPFDYRTIQKHGMNGQ